MSTYIVRQTGGRSHEKQSPHQPELEMQERHPQMVEARGKLQLTLIAEVHDDDALQPSLAVGPKCSIACNIYTGATPSPANGFMADKRFELEDGGWGG